ncbi:MAG: TonB-dependent receptor domain-containing protein, partial [Bryobacteraceae bacterium]
IKRDRIFIFGAYEGYRERAFRQVSGNTPTSSFREEILRAVPIYQRAFDTMPLPNQPHDPNEEVGFFLSAAGSPARDNHVVVKGDVRVTDASNLSLTYTRGRPVRVLPSYRIGNDRQWLGTQERGTASYVFGGPAWTSETRFGYNLNIMDREDLFWTGGIDPNFPETLLGGRRTPAIQYPGFSTADSELNHLGGPVWTLEQKYALHIGAHSLKIGGKFSHRGGGRSNIENARVRFDTKDDLLSNQPSRIQVTFGVNPYTSSSQEFGVFAQDDWRVNPKLVINLGLRYDFFGKFVAEPTTDAPAGLFNLDGLLDDRFTFGPFRDANDPFENDAWANFGPRLGFSYNPDGRGATVIRGGFGVMFSPLMWGTFNNAVSSSQTVPFRVNLVRAEVERLNLKFPAFNEDIRPLVEVSSQVQVADIFKPDIEAPYSMNVYLGVQRSLSNSLMLETAFVGNRGVKFFMYRIFNPVDRITGERPNPNLGQGNYLDDSQNTVHYSWQTSLRKRYSHGVTGSAHYTWGRSLSYTGGDIGATFQGDSSTVVQDFFNWRAERGPSAGDVTHYFASDLVWEMPFLRNASNQFLRHTLGGWQLSGVFRAQTGDALTITQPSAIPS